MKSELLQNSSDSQLLLMSSKLKYEEARGAETEMKQQFLSMRSCSSLPDLLSSERRTIWTGRNSLRSVSTFNHTVDQLQICSPAIMRCKEPGAMPRPRSEGFRYFRENCHFHSANNSAADNYMQNFISLSLVLGLQTQLSYMQPKIQFSLSPWVSQDQSQAQSWSGHQVSNICQYIQ